MTLSKALGSQGGAVLAPARVLEQVMNASNAFLFDTALAPASAAAALAALHALKEEPALAQQVRDNAANIAMQLKAAGLKASLPDAAVISVQAPSPETAVAWAAACADLTESDVDKAVKVISATAPRGAAS